METFALPAGATIIVLAGATYLLVVTVSGVRRKRRGADKAGTADRTVDEGNPRRA
jgi:hypothetical protein